MSHRSLIVAMMLVGACAAPALADPRDPPNSPADPFLWYKAKVTKDTAALVAQQAAISDRFINAQNPAPDPNPQTYDIKKIGNLALPADKALIGVPVQVADGVVDAVTHMQAYKAKLLTGLPKLIPVLNNRVIDTFTPPNQAFALRIDVKKPDVLLVPTAKDLVVPPAMAPNPMAHNVDNYMCYQVKVTKDTPKFTPRLVDVSTQFSNLQNPAADPNAKRFEVKKPKHLCVPANVNSGGIKNAVGTLMCYSVKLAKADPAQLKHVAITPTYINSNPFGPLNLTSGKETELCVPATFFLNNEPLCGNNKIDNFNEICDGTAPSPCPGQCNSLCACPVNFTFNIDPSNSQAIIKGGLGWNTIIPVTGLSGAVSMSVGPDVIPLSGVFEIKVSPASLPGITLFGLATVCPFLIDDGSGYAGSGYVNCTGYNLANEVGYPDSPDISSYLDHVVDGPNNSFPNGGAPCSGLPGFGSRVDVDTGLCVPDGPQDPGCVSGNVDATHAGVCNGDVVGPIAGTTPWTATPGHAVVNFNFGFEVVQPPGPCPPAASFGPFEVPGTTGTTISAIMDAFPGEPPAGVKTQALQVVGTPFNCTSLLTGGPITGTKLVGTFPILDLSLLGPTADVNGGIEFTAQ